VLTRYVPLSDLPGEHLRIFGFAFADTLYHVRCCHLGLTASDLARVDWPRLAKPAFTQSQ